MVCSTLIPRDHEGIYLIPKKRKKHYKRVDKYGRSYVNYNKKLFQDKIKNQDWSDIYLESHVNVIWNRIEMIIRNEIDEMCPIKKIEVVDRNDPWITRQIIELMHDKDTWRKKAKKSNNPEDWGRARALRNLVNKCVSNANENATRKTGKDKCTKINLIDRNSKLPVDNDRLPDYINEYFANIGNRLADKFSGDWHSLMETLEVELGDINFTEKDVIKMCQNIDIGKSSALDNLSSKVLKDAFLAAPQVLTHCFKKSVETGVFPMAWKRALVVPLFKGGDPCE